METGLGSQRFKAVAMRMRPAHMLSMGTVLTGMVLTSMSASRHSYDILTN
jgi:hypothetical protein